MLIALRDFAVGDHQVKAGEPIPRDVTLPSGRVDSLRNQRYVIDAPDESLTAELLADIDARITRLEDAATAPKRATRKQVAA